MLREAGSACRCHWWIENAPQIPGTNCACPAHIEASDSPPCDYEIEWKDGILKTRRRA